MKDLEKDMKSTQQRAAAVKAALINHKAKRDTLVAELTAARAEATALNEQLSICNAGVARLTAETESLLQQV